MGLSVDPVDHHAKWSEDIKETQGAAPNYPMIGDTDFNVSKLYDMLPAATSGDPRTRTPADNQTVRNVFIIGPDKKIKLVLVYPMTTGRNFQEILRVIDSLQMTAKHRVATPADWKQGDDVIIAGSVSDDEAKGIYPGDGRRRSPTCGSCRSRSDGVRRHSGATLSAHPGSRCRRTNSAAPASSQPPARRSMRPPSPSRPRRCRRRRPASSSACSSASDVRSKVA